MTPRIAPVSGPERTEEVDRALGPIAAQEPLDNVFGTFVRHPDLYRRFAKLAGHVLFASSLDPRRRELAILRIGWRNGCRYEFAAHQKLAQAAGIAPEEIGRLCRSDIPADWREEDALVLQAVDELYDTRTIGDDTWDRLARTLDQHQMMDLVFTIGTYNLVSWSLNAFRVDVDDHFGPYPWSTA